MGGPFTFSDDTFESTFDQIIADKKKRLELAASRKKSTLTSVTSVQDADTWNTTSRMGGPETSINAFETQKANDAPYREKTRDIDAWALAKRKNLDPATVTDEMLWAEADRQHGDFNTLLGAGQGELDQTDIKMPIVERVPGQGDYNPYGLQYEPGQEPTDSQMFFPDVLETTHGKGVYGRNVVEAVNPATGVNLNQEMNTPENNANYDSRYNDKNYINYAQVGDQESAANANKVYKISQDEDGTYNLDIEGKTVEKIGLVPKNTDNLSLSEKWESLITPREVVSKEKVLPAFSKRGLSKEDLDLYIEVLQNDPNQPLVYGMSEYDKENLGVEMLQRSYISLAKFNQSVVLEGGTKALNYIGVMPDDVYEEKMAYYDKVDETWKKISARSGTPEEAAHTLKVVRDQNMSTMDYLEDLVSNRKEESLGLLADSAALMLALSQGAIGFSAATYDTDQRIVEAFEQTNDGREATLEERSVIVMMAFLSTSAERLGLRGMMGKLPLVNNFITKTLAKSPALVRALGKVVGTVVAGTTIEGTSGFLSNLAEHYGANNKGLTELADDPFPTKGESRDAFGLEALGGGIVSTTTGVVNAATTSSDAATRDALIQESLAGRATIPLTVDEETKLNKQVDALDQKILDPAISESHKSKLMNKRQELTDQRVVGKPNPKAVSDERQETLIDNINKLDVKIVANQEKKDKKKKDKVTKTDETGPAFIAGVDTTAEDYNPVTHMDELFGTIASGESADIDKDTDTFIRHRIALKEKQVAAERVGNTELSSDLTDQINESATQLIEITDVFSVQAPKSESLLDVEVATELLSIDEDSLNNSDEVNEKVKDTKLNEHEQEILDTKKEVKIINTRIEDLLSDTDKTMQDVHEEFLNGQQTNSSDMPGIYTYLAKAQDEEQAFFDRPFREFIRNHSAKADLFSEAYEYVSNNKGEPVNIGGVISDEIRAYVHKTDLTKKPTYVRRGTKEDRALENNPEYWRIHRGSEELVKLVVAEAELGAQVATLITSTLEERAKQLTDSGKIQLSRETQQKVDTELQQKEVVAKKGKIGDIGKKKTKAKPKTKTKTKPKYKAGKTESAEAETVPAKVSKDAGIESNAKVELDASLLHVSTELSTAITKAISSKKEFVVRDSKNEIVNRPIVDTASAIAELETLIEQSKQGKLTEFVLVRSLVLRAADMRALSTFREALKAGALTGILEQTLFNLKAEQDANTELVGPQDLLSHSKESFFTALDKTLTLLDLYQVRDVNRVTIGQINTSTELNVDNLPTLLKELGVEDTKLVEYLTDSFVSFKAAWETSANPDVSQINITRLDGETGLSENKPLSWLYEKREDGTATLSDEVLFNIMLNSIKWLNNESKSTLINRNETIADFVYGDPYVDITREDRAIFGTGVPGYTLYQELGQNILGSLNLKLKKDPKVGGVEDATYDRSTEDKLIQALGTIGIHLLSMHKHDGVNNVLTHKVIHPVYEEKSEDRRISSTESVRLYTLNPSSQESVETSQEVLKNNIDDFAKLLGVQASFKGLYFTPVASVQKRIPGSYSKVPTKVLQLQAKEQSTGYVLKPTEGKVLRYIDGDTIRALMDVKDPAEEHIEHRKGEEARNSEIDENIAYLEEYLSITDAVNELTNPLNIDNLVLENGNVVVYSEYKAGKTHRMYNLSPNINGMRSKIDRHIFAPVGTSSTVNGVESRALYKMAVAQAFGFSIDKHHVTPSIDFFNQEVLGSVEITKAVSLIRKINAGEDVNRGEVNAALKAVHNSDLGNNMHVIEGLSALAVYDANASFTTNVTLEIDGVTNGYAISLLQFLGEDTVTLKKSLGRVGFTFPGEATYEEMLAEQDSDGNKVFTDTYETFGSYIFDLLNLVDTNAYYTKKKLKTVITEEALTALSSIHGNIKDINGMITKFARELAKNPFMISNYGAGLSKILDNVANDVIDNIYFEFTKIQKDYLNAKDEAGRNEVIVTLKTLIINTSHLNRMKSTDIALEGFTAFTAALKNNTLREVAFTKQYKKKLQAQIKKVYRPSFEQALERLLGPTTARKETLVKAYEVSNIMFAITFEQAQAKFVLEHNRTPNYNEKQLIVSKLLDTVYPKYQGPWMDDGSYIDAVKRTKTSDGTVKTAVKPFESEHVTKSLRSEVPLYKRTPKEITAYIESLGFEAPGVAVIINMVHNFDSVLMGETALVADFLAIFDASIVSIGNAQKVSETYDNRLLEFSRKYRFVDVALEDFLRVLQNFSDNKANLQLLKKIYIDSSYEAETAAYEGGTVDFSLSKIILEIKVLQKKLANEAKILDVDGIVSNQLYLPQNLGNTSGEQSELFELGSESTNTVTPLSKRRRPELVEEATGKGIDITNMTVPDLRTALKRFDQGKKVFPKLIEPVAPSMTPIRPVMNYIAGRIHPESTQASDFRGMGITSTSVPGFYKKPTSILESQQGYDNIPLGEMMDDLASVGVIPIDADGGTNRDAFVDVVWIQEQVGEEFAGNVFNIDDTYNNERFNDEYAFYQEELAQQEAELEKEKTGLDVTQPDLFTDEDYASLYSMQIDGVALDEQVEATYTHDNILNVVSDLNEHFKEADTKDYIDYASQETHSLHLDNVLQTLLIPNNEILRGVRFKAFETTLDINNIPNVSQGKFNLESNIVQVHVNAGIPFTYSEQTRQEVYTHELVHVVSAHVLNNNEGLANKLRKLHKQTAKFVTVETFLHKDANGKVVFKSDEKAERAAAQRQYNYLFKTIDAGRKPHEFLAYALTNKFLVKALQDTTYKEFSWKDTKTTTGNFLTKFVELMVEVWDRFAATLAGNTKAKSSIHEEAVKVIQAITVINDRKKPGYKKSLRDIAFRKAFKKANFMTQGGAKKLYAFAIYLNQKNAYRKHATALMKQAGFAKTTISNSKIRKTIEKDLAIFHNLLSNKLEEITALPAESGIRIKLEREARMLTLSFQDEVRKTLRSVGVEIFGTTPVELIQSVLRVKKEKDEHRRFTKEQTMISLLDGFVSFEGRPQLGTQLVTDVHDVYMKTDFIALIDGAFTVEEAVEFLTDDVKLDAAINKYANLAGTKTNEFFRQKVIGLVDIMTQGTTEVESAYMNAHNIVQVYALEYKKPEILETDAVHNLDVLISLLALKETPAEQRANVNTLTAREFKVNNTENGILNLLGQLKDFKEESFVELFNSEHFSTVKGYTGSIVDTDKKIRVEPIADEEAMLKEGYKLIRDEDGHSILPPIKGLPNSAFQNNRKVGLYVTTSDPALALSEGIFSTTSEQSSGTLVSGILFEENPDRLFMVKGLMNRYIASQGKVESANIASKTVTKGSKPSPIVNRDMEIVDYRINLPHQHIKEYLNQDTDFIAVFGQMRSHLVDKVVTKELNKEHIDTLVADSRHYVEGSTNYVNIMSAQYMPLTFDRLPKSTKYLLEKEVSRSLKGEREFWVKRDSIDLFFGSVPPSFANLKYLRNIPRYSWAVKNGESILKAVVRMAIVNVVIKIFGVLKANVTSNSLYLMFRGADAAFIIREKKNALIAHDRWQKDAMELEQLMIKAKAYPHQAAKLKKKADILVAGLRANPVDKFMTSGLFVSYTEEILQNEYNYTNKVAKFLTKKFPKISGATKDSFLSKFFNESYMTEKSHTYKPLLQALQLSDFVARYALYKHLTESEKVAPKAAWEEVIKAFIAYDIPMDRHVKYANDMGLILFARYWLRIQSVGVKLAKTEPASLAFAALMENTTGLNPADILESHILLGNIAPPEGGIDKIISEAGVPPGWEFANELLP